MANELKALFYLKKNQKRKIVFVLSWDESMLVAQFSQKIDVDIELWDTKAGKPKRKSGFACDVNKQIGKVNLLVYSRYNEALRLGHSFFGRSNAKNREKSTIKTNFVTRVYNSDFGINSLLHIVLIGRYTWYRYSTICILYKLLIII